MYIIKNAFKSISRSKGRNILIGIILTVIAIASCVALTIKNAANEVVTSYKNSNDIIATLTLDRKNLQSDFKKNESSSSSTDSNPKDFMSSIPKITSDLVKTYGTSDYVKNYYYSTQTNVNSSNISKVTEDTSTQNSQSGGGRQMQQGFAGQTESGDFRLVGYSSLDAMSQFVSGTYKVTSGSMFDVTATDNPCVISNELSDKNSLSVGSTITLTNPNNTSESYSFKVVGIYTDNSDNSSDGPSLFSNAANQILTTSTAVETVVKNSEANSSTELTAQVSPEFVLKSADNIDSFKSELTSKGLSSYYTISTNEDSVNSSIKPIENLSSFASIFLIIVLAIGGVILLILNMINIRERKYEIGVLRAIGMKKHKVLAQFLCELIMVTIISIILGTIIGAIASVPTANYMLKNEISSAQSTQNTVDQNFGRSGSQSSGYTSRSGGGMFSAFGANSNVNYISKINAVIDPKIVLELALIGLALTIISGSVSMVFISRYSPLKILSNRT